jgi:hypothetical protein
VHSQQFPDLENFPASQRCTYEYYAGRQAQLDGNHAESARLLSSALALCEAGSRQMAARGGELRATFFFGGEEGVYV